MTREHIFWIVVVLLPVGFFAGMEASLRAINYGPDLSLFVAAPATTGDVRYLQVNPRVTQRYFPPGYFAPDTSGDLFVATKPEHGFRVFTLGGSTTAGWPYPSNVSFPRLLGRQLARRLPGRQVEVINAAITAVNSHTMLDFIDEILEQEPDLILIYGGHNEFYGALGAGSTISSGESRALIRAYLWLQQLRISALVTNVVNRAKALVNSDPPGVDTLRESPTLMGQVIGDSEIFLDDATFIRARSQFQANLDDIARRARAAGVPLVLSELVSNIRDQAPFVSKEDANNPAAATVYARAETMREGGDYDGARDLFYRAKDLDLLRFRAPEAFNKVIHSIGKKFDLPVVPMRSVFESASDDGLIGNNLMVEHLHPNTGGQLLMSQAFLETIEANGLAPGVSIPEVGDGPDNAWQDGAITELDNAIGKIRILDLTDHWPFKPEAETSDAVNRYNPVGLTEVLAKRIFANQTGVEQAHVRMAEYYATRKQYDLAMREYWAIADMAPLVTENYFKIADVLIDAGVSMQALPFLERSLEIRTEPWALKRIGQILLFSGNADAAIESLRRAYELDPSDAELSQTLGFAYLTNGRREQALAVLNPDSNRVDETLERTRRFGSRLQTRFSPAVSR